MMHIGPITSSQRGSSAFTTSVLISVIATAGSSLR
jgi:hypothetical protein